MQGFFVVALVCIHRKNISVYSSKAEKWNGSAKERGWIASCSSSGRFMSEWGVRGRAECLKMGFLQAAPTQPWQSRSCVGPAPLNWKLRTDRTQPQSTFLKYMARNLNICRGQSVSAQVTAICSPTAQLLYASSPTWFKLEETITSSSCPALRGCQKSSN